MRALVVAPQPFLSPRGTPLSVYYRTLVTAQLGVEVDLVTYGYGDDVDIQGVQLIRILKLPFVSEVPIGPSFLKAVLDLLIVLKVIQLLLRKRFDFVHAHEESIFFCRLLKKIFRFRLIYDMHSSLPQQLSNFGYTKSRAVLALFRYQESAAIRESDAVITICPDLAQHASRLIDDPRKHHLIENSIFDPVRLKTTGSSKIEAGPPGHVSLPQNVRIVAYAGTLEPYQGIDLLLGSFGSVCADVHDAFLVVVGGRRVQISYYKKMANRLGIEEKVLFVGQVTKQMAQLYCSQASVQVSPRISGTNTPLKIYEQLASGIPLVATNVYSHTQVLTPDVAFLVEPQREPMARGIVLALTSARESADRVSAAQQMYRVKYSRQAYEQKMRLVLAQVSRGLSA